MKQLTRLFALVMALCLLFGGALADECGLGTAVSVKRADAPAAAAAAPAEAPAEAVHAAAVRAESGEALATNPLENENTTRGFVYRMYKIVLGREPDPAGFESWVKALESGGSGAADLIVGFFNSDEYTGKGKSSEAVVDDCYQAMLNRPADHEGLEAWKKILDIGMSSDSVCAGFVNSSEFQALAAKYGIQPGTIRLTKARDQNYERTAFAYRLYRDCLGRYPDIGGLEYWCTLLGNGYSGTNVAYGFVFSDEYRSRHTTNEVFVDMLYQAILGRAAEASGLKSWTATLDYSSTRERVLNGFMRSDEFAKKCQLAGIKVGKQIVEPDNTTSWKANILVLSLVNAERARYGIAPLTTREDLWEGVAQIRATELKKRFDPEHTRPDGRSWDTAFDDAKIPYVYAAENIAYGYKTEQDVVQAWMNSPLHRANILDQELMHLATGLYVSGTRYWSQDFFTPWLD